MSCELALHWFCSQNNYHQFVALPLLPTNTTLQTRTLESYIIQKWCPRLNYPFILQRQVTKQHSTPHLRQALRTTYLGIGHRLYAQLRRRLMCNTQASQNTQASAPFYQHSLKLHNNIIQPDTLYHTQCNHSVPPQFSDSLCSNSTTTTTTTYGTHRPTANTSTICQLCVYTTSILSRFQHTTSQHSHAMSSATTTLQRSHTQSSALTTTIWIIRHLPVYTTVNKHDTSTTTTSHAIFTAISNHYSFNSTTESQQAQPYTISHHTQEAQIHHRATQPTQIYETTSLTSQITPQIHHTTFQTPQITTPITTSTPASFTSQATSLKH